MKPRDWFVLVLRAFGIYELILTLDTILSIFNIIAHFTRLEQTQVEAYVTHAFLSFALTVWLLKFAPQTAKWLYPEDRASEEQGSSDSQSRPGA